MGISIIRKLDADDMARVTAAAERFCKRHEIKFDEYTPAEMSIDYAIDNAHSASRARLRKLWTACYCRALRVPCDVRTTTGWGYVGTSC